jgi:pyruvate/2-oxoglutarate dehydrogenase complex dihydrolipoamide acyltransferase (E2) component
MIDPTPLRMPNLGAEATSATIASWLRAVGDLVAAGEVIAELETEKATVELEAPASGRLAEIRHPAGTEVTVGETLALIEPEGSG